MSHTARSCTTHHYTVLLRRQEDRGHIANWAITNWLSLGVIQSSKFMRLTLCIVTLPPPPIYGKVQHEGKRKDTTETIPATSPPPYLSSVVPEHYLKYNSGVQFIGFSSQIVFSRCAQEVSISFLFSSVTYLGAKQIWGARTLKPQKCIIPC